MAVAPFGTPQASRWKPDTNLHVIYDAKRSILAATTLAIAGQRIFRLDALAGYTALGFVPGTNNVHIYVNGLYQTIGVDYVEVDEFTIRLTNPQAAGARFTAVLYTQIKNYDAQSLVNLEAIKEMAAQVEIYSLAAGFINTKLQAWAGGDENYVGDLNGQMVDSPAKLINDSAEAIAEQAILISQLALPGGSNQLGFVAAGAGAVPQSVQKKLRQQVAIADYREADDLDDTASLLRAIATGAKKIQIGIDAIVSAQCDLRPNQTIDFAGGTITVPVGSTIPVAVLYGQDKAGVVIKDALIDASATPGVGGIFLQDCPGAKVTSPKLVKANMGMLSTSGIQLKNKVIDPEIDLDGYATVGFYISGINGLNIKNPVIYHGQEGMGVYNGARNIQVEGGSLYDHLMDGFVVINGQQITVTGTSSYNNGQSGFTTQRQTAASNCRRVRFIGCCAWLNLYDGFDIRGGNTGNWPTPLGVTLDGCEAWLNMGCGFYVVYAPFVKLVNCTATQNDNQGLFVDWSPNCLVGNFTSISNANAIVTATFKSGIQVVASPDCVFSGCQSGNGEGATQAFGISLVGESWRCRVIGGEFSNNSNGFYNDEVGTTFIGTRDGLDGGGVYTDIVSTTGVKFQSGFSPPTHTTTIGTIYSRAAGGSELYISNGNGTWRLI